MLTAAQEKFLIAKLGMDTEDVWDGEGTVRVTIINNGEIELSTGDYLRRARVYVDKGYGISKIVWSYRKREEYLSEGEISEGRAYDLINIEMRGD